MKTDATARSRAPIRRGDSTRGGLALSLAVLTAASISVVAYSVDAQLIRQDIGLTTVGVGAMTSVVYIGAAASSVVGGRMTDRRGPMPVLLIALALLAIGSGLSAIATSVVVLFAGILVTGLGYGWVNPPTNVISNPVSVRRRALSMSVKQTGIPLGGAVAGVLVSSLAADGGWRLSLVAPIVACVLLGAAVALWCPRATAQREFSLENDSSVRLKMPGAWVFGFLMNGVQGTIFAFLALYLAEERGLSTAAAGVALSVLLVGGVIGRPFWGWLSDRMHRDRVRVLQLTALIAGAALLLLPSVSVVVDYLLLPVIGMTSVGWNGAFIATMTEAAQPESVGLETGIAMVMVNLGPVLAPPVLGAIAGGTVGWRVAWIACATLSLTCAAVLQFSRRTQ